MKTTEPINVIEVRRAANGYVVCAFMRRQMDTASAVGYATYVVESDNPADVGRAVERAIRDHAITSDAVIPPARELP